MALKAGQKKPKLRVSHQPFKQNSAAASSNCSSGNGCQTSCNLSSR